MATATKRKPVSKKVRFEVFKRDGFKCQYCGATAPEVVLHADHIEPVSKGGASDMMNLITSCEPCNAGKSDRRIDDTSALAKQRAQLEELTERREQLEMMLAWRNGLLEIDAAEYQALCGEWTKVAPGWKVVETDAKKYLKKYGLQAVLAAIDTIGLQYIEVVDGWATRESVQLAWTKLGGTLHVRSLPEEKRRLRYIKGILRNRFVWVPFDVIDYLEVALQNGIDVGQMEKAAKELHSWPRYLDWLEGRDWL